ncbi:hypothetical protein [Pararhizobium haloflavum]|uniref:hypothetical protein n=1 Tax=Pararhizobium haloflavum TaxID=2037914 RepID=UPI0027BA0FF1|nr:hypothetical protein [Pararhizobium haloflavum]
MTPFTFFHVALSLVGIVAGLAVVAAWLRDHRHERWTDVFLISTLATTVTGFMFPFTGFTPALGVGIVSALVLVVALVARYGFRLSNHWRETFIITSLVALYLNVFVLVVQAFQKIAVLNALAPTGTEQPFALVQGLVLLGFIFVGYLLLSRHRMVPA